MAGIWREHLEGITPYKPGKPIEEVQRELGLKKVFKLASNENPMGPSPRAVKAAVEEAARLNRYPDGGCFRLRKALSDELSVPENSLVFGTGSDEIIVLALHAFVGPGEEVVVADPTFMVYHIASMVRNARVKAVPLKDYKYDLKGMAEAVTDKTRVVFIANPDNPTGSYVSEDELTGFVEEVSRKALVFIDEAYYEYAKGDDYPETLDLTRRDDMHVVVARTFSKAYGLAGARIGYGVARPEIAEVLNKVREPFNVNSVAQAAALAALSDKAYMRKSVKMVLDEKKRFYEFFESEGVTALPSRGNFILLDVGVDSTELFNRLLKKGIIVRDMSAWRLKGFIRVNMGFPEENNAFFKAFREVMADLTG